MNRAKMEGMLIEYCAPTLVGIKATNMFTLFSTNKKQVLRDVKDWNRIISEWRQISPHMGD